MRIKLTSIMVDNQEKALKFYTEVFGFVKKQESLEPNANPAGKAFQEAIFKQGLPIAAFEVGNLDKEFRRLKELGVTLTKEPTRMGPVTIAVCSDTCGNLIQLYQPPGSAA